MMKPILMTLSAALLLSACATAGSTDADATTQTASLEQTTPETISSTFVNEDGLVCKFRDVTGSNFRRKVCATPEQWAEAEAAARDATNRIQRQNRGFEPSN